MNKWVRSVDDDLFNIGSDLDSCLIYRRDRQRAYVEGFKEFVQYAVKTSFNGKEWYAHQNVNMYWDTMAACNARCGFCIANTTFSRGTAPRTFVNSAYSSVRCAQEFNASVQVVGGEPTLFPLFKELVDIIDSFEIRNPVLGTNGWALGKHRDLLNKSTFNHINVSRHHYDDVKNNEIMLFNKLFTNDRFIENMSGFRQRIRLQCNLISGYIDSYEEVLRFIEFAADAGIDNVVFAQLTPLPENDIYQHCIIDYVSSRQVDIDEILNSVSCDPRWKFVKYRGGVACYYEIWEYENITVTFKFSDNYYLSLVDSIPRFIPDIVLHTDGTLCGSWNRNIKQLT